MTKISPFSILIIFSALLSCATDGKTTRVAIDDLACTFDLPLNYEEIDPSLSDNGTVPYVAYFIDSGNASEFGVFKGPPLDFTEEDLAFYTDYIESQYGSAYQLLNSKYGKSACCTYFLFLQKSTAKGSYREFYLLSPDGKKLSLGFEALFLDPKYSIEAIVAGVELD